MGDVASRGPSPVAVVLGVLALLVVASAAGVVRDLGRELAADPRLPLWDGAKYGLDGLRLAQAGAGFDLAAVAVHLYGMDVWGPVFPLLEAAAFLVSGSADVTVPRRLVLGLFAGLLLATAAAGWWLETARTPAGGCGRWRGAGVGLLAAALVAASPASWLFATLVMLEVPGALLAVAAFALWCRAERRGHLADWRLADWRLVWVATLLLVFTKANYALLWLGPLFLVEAVSAAGGGRALLGRLAAAWRGLGRRRRSTVVALVVAAVLVAIAAVGGVGAVSLGNPLYALYLLLVLSLVVGGRATRRRLADRWQRLAPRWRSFGRWVVAPLGVWLLLPPHLKEMVGFLENRDSAVSRWSVEGLLVYPRAVLGDYAAHPAVGLAVLVLAVGLAFRWRRLDRPRRLLVLLAVGGFVVATAHDYKLSRFLFTVVPFLYLAAATTAADLVAAAARRLGAGRRAAAAGLTLTLVAAGLLAPGIDSERLRRERRAATARPDTRLVLDAIAAADAPFVVLGSWNDLSPALVEWHLRGAGGRAAAARFLGDWRTLAEEPDRRAVHAALRRLPPGTVVVTLRVIDRELLPRWRDEAGWLGPLAGELAADPAFQRLPSSRVGATGYRLRRFERR